VRVEVCPGRLGSRVRIGKDTIAPEARFELGLIYRSPFTLQPLNKDFRRLDVSVGG
jgi:hypothetical protein